MVGHAYPSTGSERTRWTLERRGQRNDPGTEQPYAFFVESERSRSGEVTQVATIFLTNRECPWKCVMCDLWRNTTSQSLAPGQIPAQIRFALGQLESAPVLKLYNSGSFFDPGAIPREDWPQIAQLCQPIEHLIVECHPRLVGPSVLDFRALLSCSLEVALGLETAHPDALAGLNKRITPEDYQRATSYLKRNGISVRTFLLVNPPLIPFDQQEVWMERSLRYAFDCDSDVVSLIPLRAGNGAVEALIERGLAQEPTLENLEKAQESGLLMHRGRIFADTWDLQRFSKCPVCFDSRSQRLHRMNLSQEIEQRIPCPRCAGN